MIKIGWTFFLVDTEKNSIRWNPKNWTKEDWIVGAVVVVAGVYYYYYGIGLPPCFTPVPVVIPDPSDPYSNLGLEGWIKIGDSR